MNDMYCTRQCALCRRYHSVRIDRTEASNQCFTGLMGSTEMECALAVVLNKARESGCLFPDVVVKEEDFSREGYEYDGFREMIAYGWLVEVAPDGCWSPDPQLVRRLHQRVPNA